MRIVDLVQIVKKIINVLAKKRRSINFKQKGLFCVVFNGSLLHLSLSDFAPLIVRQELPTFAAKGRDLKSSLYDVAEIKTVACLPLISDIQNSLS